MRSNDIPALHGWRHAASDLESEMYIPLGSTAYDAEEVLLVSTNRISAHHRTSTTMIPGKAVVSNQLLLWWYEQLKALDIPDHFISGNFVPEHVAGRALLCARLDMYPVQCQVFGFMTANLELLYRQDRRIGGVELPEGLQFGDRLPEPVCVVKPTSRLGAYDQNLPLEQISRNVGQKRLDTMIDYSLCLYQEAARTSERKGLVLAQATFEYGDGLGYGGPLVVAGGHLLASGSTVFWPLDRETGTKAVATRYSLERQPLYDWLSGEYPDWTSANNDHLPDLPPELVQTIGNRFEILYEVLTERTVNF